MSLSPLSNDALLTEPHLILYVSKQHDLLTLIPTTARKSAGRTYFASYKHFSYRSILESLDREAKQLVVEDFRPRLSSLLSDEDLNKKFKKQDQDESDSLRSLKLRWSMIEPLVTGLNKAILFDRKLLQTEVTQRARELSKDPAIQAALATRKRGSKRRESRSNNDHTRVLVAELKRLLNQYWAGGSRRGALINFAGNCGGKGQRKKATTIPLGRKSAHTKSNQTGHEPLIITPGSVHEEIIAYCIEHYLIRGTTVAEAVRRMWSDFYSETVQLDNGQTKRDWLPANQRPTRPQFEYRASLAEPEQAAWRRQLAPNEFSKKFRAIMGSSSDDIKAVGQRGGIDASPIDIQLVKLGDRLARIGSANRILLADSMYGYIPGFYVGLDAPSSRTVKLAVHHALDPDKAAWLEGLGLDHDPNDWIPIHFTNLWADNTDLRSEEVMRCLSGIGTDVHFVPVRRADLNSRVESSHHKIHRMLDHKMLGSTYGKVRADRGEASAIDRARHTLVQAIRETARAVHVHNTMELDIARPLWMREQGVLPTRLHMTRATIERGKIARSLYSFDHAHIHLLPRHQGTFTPQGVRLHREDTGQKICFIKPIVYVSDHPTIVRKVEEARRGGKHDPNYFRATFLVDPNVLKHCWYLDLATMEIIPLNVKISVVDDVDLPNEATLTDVVGLMDVDAVEAPVHREAREKKVAAMEYEQRQAKSAAEAEYQDALRVAGGKPSKAQLRSNRATNRETEKSQMLHGIPLILTLKKEKPEAIYNLANNVIEPKVEGYVEKSIPPLAISFPDPLLNAPSMQPPSRGSALKAAVMANRKK
ncbi:hypothetical protein [Comamonas testosteroni]|uniref:hypothetical protein n=1 Tax=Comamonas testosteroni TaxID=285 RepID=UPI00391A0147